MNLIDNKYKILKEFNSKTFLAETIDDNTKVVLKKLEISKISDWKIVELFKRESEILKHLNHKGIPKYIDTGHILIDDNNIFYLVQEYIEGDSLKDFIEKGIPLTKDEIYKITQEILEILDYLSELTPSIVHRDIKPSNIMIKKDRSIALIDFGAIKNVSSNTNKDITVVGTTGFMAPEQLMGKEATIQSDLYSVGATLINLLTRKNPTDLPIKEMKIQFRKEMDFNNLFKDFIEHLIEPKEKNRFENPKKALKALERVKLGKLANKELQNNFYNDYGYDNIGDKFNNDYGYTTSQSKDDTYEPPKIDTTLEMDRILGRNKILNMNKKDNNKDNTLDSDRIS